MPVGQPLRVECRCSGCGRVAVVTFRHRPSSGGRNREVPVHCPYEECGRTMVMRLDAQVDPQTIIVRQHDGIRPAQA